MGVFEAIGTDSHEEVLFGVDHASGLQTIIAIHSTALGPALGGTRFFPYPSEAAALEDVLRLSKAMTYKAAVSGLDLGGGKAVIIGDPAALRSERLLRAYGRLIDSLGGRYITAEDVGTTLGDMVLISKETDWIGGLPHSLGGSGDPSPATARGVLAAIRATAQRLWSSEDLAGKRVAIQGVGKVGMSLAERLTDVGAETIVADTNDRAVADAVTNLGSKGVDVADIYGVDCDILAPCALGGGLNERSIPQLRCAAVVGSANNQLARESDADLLESHGVLYAPDFVVNAGGVINIAAEHGGYSIDRAAEMVDGIYDNLTAVFEAAERNSVNPHRAAASVAEDRIAAIGTLAQKRRAAGTRR